MTRGPGTHLKALIVGILGVRVGGCGGCQQLLEEMDNKGPQWCRANVCNIVPRIRANARKNKDWRAKILAYLPGITAPIYGLVFHAIDLAEAELAAEQAAKEQANPES